MKYSTNIIKVANILQVLDKLADFRFKNMYNKLAKILGIEIMIFK